MDSYRVWADNHWQRTRVEPCSWAGGCESGRRASQRGTQPAGVWNLQARWSFPTQKSKNTETCGSMMKNWLVYLFYLSVILPRYRLKGRNTTTFTKDHVSSAITTGKTGQRGSKTETNNEDPERHFEANVHNGIWNYEWHATCALFVVPWQAWFFAYL